MNGFRLEEVPAIEQVMGDHVHRFEPIEDQCGRYVCACGQHAFRNIATGALCAARPRALEWPEVTVVHSTYYENLCETDPRRVTARFWQTCPEVKCPAFRRFVMRRRL